MRTRLAVLTLLATISLASIVTAAGNDSYVWKRNDATSTMFNGELDDLEKLNSRYGSEYIWARQSGREYVITDRTVLNETAVLFADLDRTEAPMRGLEHRMRPHERAMERAAERMETLAGQMERDLSGSAREKVRRQMQDVQEEMEQVQKKMEAVQREMQRLSTVIQSKSEKVERDFIALVNRAIRDGKAKRVN